MITTWSPTSKPLLGLVRHSSTLWICQRQFGTTNIEELVRLGVLIDIEAKWLSDGRRFLWWVRYGLHTLADAKKTSCFARQRELSQRLGFMDTESKSAVELFMQHYYRHVMALSEVNDIILSTSKRTSLPKKPNMEPLNERFRLVNGRSILFSPIYFCLTPRPCWKCSC